MPITNAPDAKASSISLLGEVFNLFARGLRPKKSASPADVPVLTTLDLKISYQSKKFNGKRDIHSSLLVGHTRQELFEKAVSAAEYYINYSNSEASKMVRKVNYSKYDSFADPGTYFTYRPEEIKEYMRIAIHYLGCKFKNYSHSISNYFSRSKQTFSKKEFDSAEYKLNSLESELSLLYNDLEAHISNHLLRFESDLFLLNQAIVDINMPSKRSLPEMTLRGRPDLIWESILKKMSGKLQPLLATFRNKAAGRRDTARFSMPDACKKCISNLLINYYLAEKVSNVIENGLYKRFVDTMDPWKQEFEKATTELENVLTNARISEQEKKTEVEKMVKDFFVPMIDKTGVLFEMFEKMRSEIKSRDGEHIKRWDTNRIEDENSPYGTVIKLINEMLEFVAQCGYSISGTNRPGVNVNERLKAVLEFKERDSAAGPDETEVSFDLTLSHSCIAGKEIKISDCPAPNNLKQYILGNDNFMLNSNKYDEIMKEGLKSDKAKSSYLEMTKEIFQGKEFLFNILEKLCSGIVGKDGLAVLEDYDKFIPLYLCVKLLEKASGATVNNAFSYDAPELSKPVIIFTKKDEQVILESKRSRNSASDDGYFSESSDPAATKTSKGSAFSGTNSKKNKDDKGDGSSSNTAYVVIVIFIIFVVVAIGLTILLFRSFTERRDVGATTRTFRIFIPRQNLL